MGTVDNTVDNSYELFVGKRVGLFNNSYALWVGLCGCCCSYLPVALTLIGPG